MGGKSRKLGDLVANKGKVMSKCLVLISEHAKIEELGLDFPYPDVWDLLPVAIAGHSVRLCLLCFQC